jgi:O-antigen/teichoic acid export membrane protein
MSGNERQFRNSSVVSTLCGIVLALFLIPEFGVHGAAIAGSVSQLIWNAFIWIQVYKQLGINVFTPDLLCSFAELSRIRGVIFQNIQAVVVKNVVGRK